MECQTKSLACIEVFYNGMLSCDEWSKSMSKKTNRKRIVCHSMNCECTDVSDHRIEIDSRRIEWAATDREHMFDQKQKKRNQQKDEMMMPQQRHASTNHKKRMVNGWNQRLFRDYCYCWLNRFLALSIFFGCDSFFFCFFYRCAVISKLLILSFRLRNSSVVCSVPSFLRQQLKILLDLLRLSGRKELRQTTYSFFLKKKYIFPCSDDLYVLSRTWWLPNKCWIRAEKNSRSFLNLSFHYFRGEKQSRSNKFHGRLTKDIWKKARRTNRNRIGRHVKGKTFKCWWFVHNGDRNRSQVSVWLRAFHNVHCDLICVPLLMDALKFLCVKSLALNFWHERCVLLRYAVPENVQNKFPKFFFFKH